MKVSAVLSVSGLSFINNLLPLKLIIFCVGSLPIAKLFILNPVLLILPLTSNLVLPEGGVVPIPTKSVRLILSFAKLIFAPAVGLFCMNDFKLALVCVQSLFTCGTPANADIT